MGLPSPLPHDRDADLSVYRIGRYEHGVSDLGAQVLGALVSGQTSLERNRRYRFGDVCRDLPNPAECWIDPALAEVVLLHHAGEGARGHEEHLVGTFGGRGDDESQADPREDIGVVTLSRNDALSVQFHRVERAP